MWETRARQCRRIPREGFVVMVACGMSRSDILKRFGRFKRGRAASSAHRSHTGRTKTSGIRRKSSSNSAASPTTNLPTQSSICRQIGRWRWSNLWLVRISKLQVGLKSHDYPKPSFKPAFHVSALLFLPILKLQRLGFLMTKICKQRWKMRTRLLNHHVPNRGEPPMDFSSSRLKLPDILFGLIIPRTDDHVRFASTYSAMAIEYGRMQLHYWWIVWSSVAFASSRLWNWDSDLLILELDHIKVS